MIKCPTRTEFAVILAVVFALAAVVIPPAQGVADGEVHLLVSCDRPLHEDWSVDLHSYRRGDEAPYWSADAPRDCGQLKSPATVPAPLRIPYSVGLHGRTGLTQRWVSHRPDRLRAVFRDSRGLERGRLEIPIGTESNTQLLVLEIATVAEEN